LRLAYRVSTRSRALEERIINLVRTGEVKFAIWGAGEEIHGTATALALSRFVGPHNFGIVPHYRSGALCSMWCALNDYEGFSDAVFRQQLSKDTDPMSRGRQMVYHLDIKEVGILPVQSPVGMQLGKAVGYAKGFRAKGVNDAVTMGIIGDGTSAEGDLHDAMNAASVWSTPTVIMITDNEIAISTTPAEGRGIQDFKAYAEGFGLRHFTCDGADFFDTYNTTVEAIEYVQKEQKPILFHVVNLPRLNAHSSAADYKFDLEQHDPLLDFGKQLVEMGVLTEDDIVKRIKGSGQDYFKHHELGSIMNEENDYLVELEAVVRTEPEPPASSIHEHIRAPFPLVEETQVEDRVTNITYGGAIRAALDNIISNHGGVMWGQDVAKLGGVMQASAGLLSKHPDRIEDAPLNEPLIMGTACGAALHDDLVALPEIQFGDYALNAFHWFVHMANTYWCTNGRSNYALIMRTPVDPFGGGAVYHSMSLDGYLSAIPGLVLLMPSTSLDIYGLLLTAAEYRGPVIVLEPKWMYRQYKGSAFPNEPTDKEEIAKLRKFVMRGGIPEIDENVRIPFSKLAVRRSGSDVTIVAWGRAVWTALDAAAELEKQGIDAEVLDLRTLVPPDLDGISESVLRTGRLIVAAEDRAFSGFVRTIQGQMVQRFPGLPSKACGQKDIPGIAQCLALEDATILTKVDIIDAAKELQETQMSGRSTVVREIVPPRFLLDT
jgi:2-oxoisovalerate dehydrogenase E1 component